MIVYWLMFAPLAFFALNEQAHGGRYLTARALGVSGVVAAIILTILIGYRYETGGDWFNYLRQFLTFRRMSLWDSIELGADPGFGLFTSLSESMDWGIIGVNVLSAAVFSIGLVVFCRQQPRSWLALLVAIPYLVIVVGMGYTRQAAAIGLAMMGLAALARGSKVSFVASVILAGMFHKSAIVLLPIAVLSTTEKRIWTAIWIAVVGAVAYWGVLQDKVDDYITYYVDADIQSQGAQIRVAMNAVPAVLFLLLRRKFDLATTERKLWSWMSIFALVSIVLLIGMSASTAVDRMGLYLIPLQLFVLSRLPDALARMNISNSLVAFGIVSYSAAVQFVWLNYATNAANWIPYRFYPFEAM